MANELDTIISLARDLPAEERAAYLDEACAGDAGRRAELAAKLAELEEADAFFDEPATMMRPRSVGSESEGTMIGPYKLLQQIGEGGFGTVWMAEQQQPVRRRVALKIIKAGMDTKEVVARFEQERQALAMMDHPNIARVFDAGATESGRLYFVMELVKGIPITRFCDEQRLPVKDRLALFNEVCIAIHHAHQKGIIHRDIKPSNIMVALLGDEPVLKVIDFGIAKATQQSLTDKTLFTRFEQFIGTPAYMSPEQASAGVVDIDTRSDIYALGILLYELLTGKPPFDPASLLSAGFDEMRRVICQQEPLKPSARISTVAGVERTELAKSHQVEPARLGHLIKGDLDWIVMRAIEKDRTRRYDSANALVADIRHFLADEPVSATPPGALYLFRKFARRHRLAFAVTSAVAAALVLGLVGTTWMFLKERAARERASEAEGRAATVSEFLLEVFRSPDPNGAGPRITVVEVLDNARVRVAADFTAQPEKRAVMEEALAASYGALGLAEKGLPLMQRALDHAQNMSGSGSDRSCRLRAELAMLQSDAGQHAEALGLLRSVMEWNSREKGPEAPLTVGNMIDLGQCLSWAELPAEACELLEAALPLSRKVFSPQHPKTISALCSLTRALSQSGRTEEALSAGREGLELSLAVHGEAHSKTFELMTSLAETLAGMGRDQEALLMAEKCLTISRKVHGDPHRTTAFAAADLAVILEKTGRTDDAIRVLQESVLPSPWCLSAKFQLGNALYGRRRYEEALVAFQEAQKGYPEGARAVELERMLMLTQEMLNKAAVPKNTEPTNLPK